MTRLTKLACALCLAAGLMDAQAFQSTQGYSGLIVIPNAQVQAAYGADIQVNGLLHSEARAAAVSAQNLIFSVGMFPRFELSGRVYTAYSETRRVENDLSGSAKLQIWSSRWLDAAVGVADFEGEAIKLDARYLVVDLKPLSSLRITLGAGEGSRLNGAFGGVEWQALPWVHLLADYDGIEPVAGLRLVTPAWRGIRAYGMAFNQPRGRESLQYAGGVSFDFGRPTRSLGSRPAPPLLQSAGAVAPREATVDSSRWGWSSADAFADACRDPGLGAGTTLREYRYGIPVREARLRCDDQSTLDTARWAPQRLADFDWRRRETWEGSGLQLRLDPVINSNVATEFGVFDYSVALQTALRLQLPSGLAVYGVRNDPVANSDDFERGRIFFGSRIRSGTEEMMLQWAAHPLPGLITNVAAGRKRIAGVMTDAVMSEVYLHSPSGAHQLMVAHGDFSPRDSNVSLGRENYYRVGYRYFWFDRDIAFGLQNGCYLLAGDCGQTVTLERFMGVMTFFVFHRYSSANEQAGGFGLQIPITPRVQPEAYRLRVGGSPDFTYSIQTTVNPADGRNTLRPNFMFEPRLRYDPRRAYLDRNRAMPGYLE